MSDIAAEARERRLKTFWVSTEGFENLLKTSPFNVMLANLRNLYIRDHLAMAYLTYGSVCNIFHFC